MKNVRLGIAGVGVMGTGHAKSIVENKVPGIQLTATCDLLPECAKLFPDSQFFTSSDAMISSGTIDAILIATPHYAHSDHRHRRRWKAGLHLMVEKPISVHKAEGGKADRRAQGTRRQVFAVMFNQRTDPYYNVDPGTWCAPATLGETADQLDHYELVRIAILLRLGAAGARRGKARAAAYC